MQKFQKGDLVHVAADLGPHMRHFTADIDAIVLGSYGDQYGTPGTGGGYSLHLKGRGHESWYKESQLTLIERGRLDLLEEWEAAEKAEIEQQSDLEWIFSNGAEVLEKGYGASIQALASAKGLGSLWGSHGEGLSWYANARAILIEATEYLANGDKAGWLAHELPFNGLADYKVCDHS